MIFPRISQTHDDVARHYDELDAFYRDVWGEHVHHGYWASGRESAAQAVEALVTRVAERLELGPGQRVCDIGCGYGATAELLAERHRVAVVGVTLSAEQLRRAEMRGRDNPLLGFRREDWLSNGFEAASFDRALSIESSEHMSDKQRFFDEVFRTLRPGGRLVVCAWLAAARPSKWHVRHLLEPICREGRLPSMGDEQDYRRMAERAGLRIVALEDLSAAVARTWTLCAARLVRKILTDGRYARFLLSRSASDRSFAATVFRIWLAYRLGAMRYCLLTAEKP